MLVAVPHVKIFLAAMSSPVWTGGGELTTTTTTTLTFVVPSDEWFIRSFLGFLNFGIEPTAWDTAGDTTKAAAAAAAMLAAIEGMTES